MPDPAFKSVSEDAIVAAVDDDEPQAGSHLRREISPLSTRRLGSVNGIDNDIVSKRELLRGKSADDQVSGVVCRSGRAHPCPPHGRFSLIHSEHRAAQRSPEIEG